MLGPELVSIDVARVTRTGRCFWCRWRDCGSARLELMRAMYMYSSRAKVSGRAANDPGFVKVSQNSILRISINIHRTPGEIYS
jgi:hypothetical protein